MTNEPAFPVNKLDIVGDVNVQHLGLTVRDYFAAVALGGICASAPNYNWNNYLLAKEAYALADAMLKERGMP